MIQLIAVVRRQRASGTKEGLARVGCVGYSWWPVLGRGRQRGLQIDPSLPGLSFLPKALFNVIVEEARADETIEAIIRANQTGEFGDGKIFLVETEAAYRISTGERELAQREVSAP